MADESNRLQEAGRNRISYTEYMSERDPEFDFDAACRKDPDLATTSSEHYPSVVRSYEYKYRGRDGTGLPLIQWVWKAFDVVTKIFQTADKAAYWWNRKAPPGQPVPVVDVPHPRTVAQRMFKDARQTISNYGYVVAVENQTSIDLVCKGEITWYGWYEQYDSPVKVSAWGIAYFAHGYSGLYNTAAQGIRYAIGDSGWYLYVAFYTYRYGSNCSYVLLSRDAGVAWDDVYYALNSATSKSAPDGCPYIAASKIDYQYAASGYAQLALATRESILTKLDYWLDAWLTPGSYKRDELLLGDTAPSGSGAIDE